MIRTPLHSATTGTAPLAAALYEFRLKAVHFGFNPSGASGKKDGFREMDVQAVLSRLYGNHTESVLRVARTPSYSALQLCESLHSPSGLCKSDFSAKLRRFQSEFA
jgi:hypothetical protein